MLSLRRMIQMCIHTVFDLSFSKHHITAMSSALLAAWLFLGCSSKTDVADTVLFNGKIITVDSSFSLQEAVAIRDGRILAVGSRESIMELAGDSTVRIDLLGHTVIPGLIE